MRLLFWQCGNFSLPPAFFSLSFFPFFCRYNLVFMNSRGLPLIFKAFITYELVYYLSYSIQTSRGPSHSTALLHTGRAKNSHTLTIFWLLIFLSSCNYHFAPCYRPKHFFFSFFFFITLYLSPHISRFIFYFSWDSIIKRFDGDKNPLGLYRRDF